MVVVVVMVVVGASVVIAKPSSRIRLRGFHGDAPSGINADTVPKNKSIAPFIEFTKLLGSRVNKSIQNRKLIVDETLIGILNSDKL